ncbi:chromatin-remodeling ATPase INO80-like isoform X1 [Clavelina lepadiformis]|uniref:chromatin-remodeling ATPase INO80-like isoform X1 n=1 Tax=Clavelina lepadiformis TaxID=159417 RepID=UPI004042119F
MDHSSLLDAFNTDAFFKQLLSGDSDDHESMDEEDGSFSQYLCEKPHNLIVDANLGKSRQWLVDLFNEESSDSDSETENIDLMLEMQQSISQYRDAYLADPSLAKYMYYSADVITGKSKWENHQRSIKKKYAKKKCDGVCSKSLSLGTTNDQSSSTSKKRSQSLQKKKAGGTSLLRKQIWKAISKKEIPKACRQRLQNQAFKLSLLKKACKDASKKVRARAIESRMHCRREIVVSRSRRMTREAQLFWKKYVRVEKYHRKNAEKQALAQRRIDDELREVYKQQRKLKFLITQTELYAHFVCGKLKHDASEDVEERSKEAILSQLDANDRTLDVFGADAELDKAKALANVNNAFNQHQTKLDMFKNASNVGQGGRMHTRHVQAQPKLLCGKLTSYQLLGVNWIFNLYVHGLNGILADDMGLGKTVQTIAFLADLAERFNIWGPFLVIAPASTLNNWHQEFSRFLPTFKVLPYWGTTSERKVLRLFWNHKYDSSDADAAPFHVLITSYQLATSDVRYFQRIQWNYIVFDEAQALKSSSSIRWKTLLEFNCRNRLLLTGTPIQNTMAELWALLHFIMPTLFDSHAEFNEWFSKNIENHLENKASIDENELSRLHVILKPFILRRLKHDVEHELTEKVEVRVLCQLAPRQRRLYDALQKNILAKDLFRAQKYPNQSTNNILLMNLVMQFRKVCNHPDIFQCPESVSPFYLKSLPYVTPRLIYDSYFIPSFLQSKSKKCFYSDLNIHTPNNVYSSLYSNGNDPISTFSFVPLLELSVGEYWKIFCKGFIVRLRQMLDKREKQRKQIHHLFFFGLRQSPCKNALMKHDPAHQDRKTPNLSYCHVSISPCLIKGTDSFTYHLSTVAPGLIFGINFKYHFYGHLSQTITSVCKSGSIIPCGLHVQAEAEKHDIHGHDFQGSSTKYRAITAIRVNEPTEIAAVLKNIYLPKAVASRKELFCHSRRTTSSVLPPFQVVCQQINPYRMNCISPCTVPIFDQERLVTESGKMLALDMLLRRLKDGGHRVLIYSQMTKMIDILEDYMLLRRHSYVRLDGSCRISSRRDTVAGFQSSDDIFVFLLSTRAGGLGINLTAADTVIFYDSDWNPTVDQQAMDRAHRLGQTKQVTVYRLVCKGTVDERMLARAEEKSAIQRMVISDGFKTDSLNQKEMVSLLLDEDNLPKLTSEDKMNQTSSVPVKRKMKRTLKKDKTMRLEAPKQTPSKNTDQSDNLLNSPRNSGKVLPSLSFSDLESQPTSSSNDTTDNQSPTEEQIIVVDDNSSSPEPLTPQLPLTPVMRGHRKRGRPRIRPIVNSRKPRFLTHVSVPRRPLRRLRGSRGRGRCFSGRAAAMAGARAGAVAASAASFRTHGTDYSALNNS